jgi:hypothetical protein
MAGLVAVEVDVIECFDCRTSLRRMEGMTGAPCQKSTTFITVYSGKHTGVDLIIYQISRPATLSSTINDRNLQKQSFGVGLDVSDIQAPLNCTSWCYSCSVAN